MLWFWLLLLYHDFMPYHTVPEKLSTMWQAHLVCACVPHEQLRTISCNEFDAPFLRTYRKKMHSHRTHNITSNGTRIGLCDSHGALVCVCPYVCAVITRKYLMFTYQVCFHLHFLTQAHTPGYYYDAPPLRLATPP